MVRSGSNHQSIATRSGTLLRRYWNIAVDSRGRRSYSAKCGLTSIRHSQAIGAELKYRDPFEFRPFARLIAHIRSGEYPKYDDKNYAHPNQELGAI